MNLYEYQEALRIAYKRYSDESGSLFAEFMDSLSEINLAFTSSPTGPVNAKSVEAKPARHSER